MIRNQKSEVGSQKQHHPTSDLRLLASLLCLAMTGCGYTSRPGAASIFKTVYVKPFVNRIDITQLSTSDQDRFPLYRHHMEVDITNEVINRFQFTGLMRPAGPDRADVRLEGELVSYHKDPLRYDPAQQVEEWRVNVVVNLRFIDQTTQMLLWEESHFVGDATYFAIGPKAESEAAALDRAITDLARRVVERTVESW